MRLRWIGYLLVGVIAAGASGFAAFELSPWPRVLLLRYAFEKSASEQNRTLEKYVPDNIVELRDQRYGARADALLDAYFPSEADKAGKLLPTIVWIHGGAFVAGSKSALGPYLKILSARGYAVMGVDYSLAPSAIYPTPVFEANEALSYLINNATRLHIDANKLFLAGDSAGSQIAAQLAAVIADPTYAAALRVAPAIDRAALKGVVLFCGVYDLSSLNRSGDFKNFLRTVMWAYFGRRDGADDPRFDEFSVNKHMTAQFPPTFVSVGNADPLAPQSVMIADAIRARGVAVDELFFPGDHDPPLPHEFQFNLDREAGREALERLSAFLRQHAS